MMTYKQIYIYSLMLILLVGCSDSGAIEFIVTKVGDEDKYIPCLVVSGVRDSEHAKKEAEKYGCRDISSIMLTSEREGDIGRVNNAYDRINRKQRGDFIVVRIKENGEKDHLVVSDDSVVEFVRILVELYPHKKVEVENRFLIRFQDYSGKME